VWRDVRNELHSQGLEVVTVALDANVDVARAIIDRTAPEHPSLIDENHLLDELFGIVNVPSGVWIDEGGTIVRPPEPAFPGQSSYRGDTPIPDTAPLRIRAMLEEARKIRNEPEKYMAAVRDWVANGAASRHALTPEEVVERSRPRPFAHAEAAAHFELGQHARRTGNEAASVRHFREAHRLQPENWTYKRQAWSLADPLQGPTDLYEGDWLTDVRKIGAENYYPPLNMD
jgi:hypothetical protein